MNSLIAFEIEGYKYGEIHKSVVFDFIKCVPIEDSRFDPYDYGIEEFPNFKNQSMNFDTVIDFEMIFSTKLNKEKQFKTILNFDNTNKKFSINLNSIKSLFETQFPLCPSNIISYINFKELKECGVFIFRTSFPFDVYYKDFLFTELEGYEEINFGF